MLTLECLFLQHRFSWRCWTPIGQCPLEQQQGSFVQEWVLSFVVLFATAALNLNAAGLPLGITCSSSSSRRRSYSNAYSSGSCLCWALRYSSAAPTTAERLSAISVVNSRLCALCHAFSTHAAAPASLVSLFSRRISHLEVSCSF